MMMEAPKRPDASPEKSSATAKSAWSRVLAPVAGGFRIRDERPRDALAREALLDRAFGLERFAKTSERLREGRLPAADLSFVAVQNMVIIATLRFWQIEAGNRASLLLGPLAVDAKYRSAGLGRALIEHGLGRARRLGHESVLLVGDAPYYTRFGFSRAVAEPFSLPGPVDPNRFLGLELVPGALQNAQGRVVAAGLIVDRLRRGEDRRLAA